jgi:hypothetical protein
MLGSKIPRNVRIYSPRKEENPDDCDAQWLVVAGDGHPGPAGEWLRTGLLETWLQYGRLPQAHDAAGRGTGNCGRRAHGRPVHL